MLLQLPSLSQIPGADCVIEAPSPQLGAIIGDVNTAGSICVALELPAGYTRIFRVKKEKCLHTDTLCSNLLRRSYQLVG